MNLLQLIKNEGFMVKPSSGGRYIMSCPFHEDNNPSFTIYPDNHWYCFSCKEVGNAITFIMKIYNLSYKKALDYLKINYKITKKLGQYENIINIIAQEERAGENVYEKYGKELIEELLAKELIKNITKIT